jgi:hypothetical protein
MCLPMFCQYTLQHADTSCQVGRGSVHTMYTGVAYAALSKHTGHMHKHPMLPMIVLPQTVPVRTMNDNTGS